MHQNVRSIGSLTLTFLVASVLAAVEPAPAAAIAGCFDGQITGASQRDDTGAFVGRGTLVLDRQVVPIDWVSVVTSFAQNPDGTLTLASSHHITSAVGQSIDFTTSDVVAATPTATPGQYDFTSHLQIVSGQNRIVSGSLVVHGWVDLYAGAVRIDSSSGELCSATDGI
jgi:hypothetical protein